MTEFRIDAVTDRDEAELIVKTNQLRGYASTVEQFSTMRWDGSDVGGGVNVVDSDGMKFVVIGRKQGN
jgi:hypothetical protein